MSSKPTLKEIADLSGVSISTVSRVLTKSSAVKASTRAHVLSVMNASAYRQMHRRSGLVALFVPNVLNPFFSLMLKGISGTARLLGYRIVVCNSEGSETVEGKVIEDLQALKIDGIIYIGADNRISVELLEIIRTFLLPVVFLDRDPELPDINLVTSDNANGMAQAVLYLLGLGHRKILYLGGTPHISAEKLRFTGFRMAMRKGGAPFDESLAVNGDFSIERGQQAMEEALDAHRGKFTAVCASNDMMALGAYKALVDRGIRVPEDISLIGYDDIPFAPISGLTTIHQPAEEMGREAILLLKKMIEGDPKSGGVRIVLGTSLAIRRSCAAMGR